MTATVKNGNANGKKSCFKLGVVNFAFLPGKWEVLKNNTDLEKKLIPQKNRGSLVENKIKQNLNE
jgi:hypothetical protein